MDVLLVSPYHSGSHEAWAGGYARASAHQVELITMPGRFWKWRMHGGPVTLAEATHRRIAEGLAPNVILTTDMLDVATYIGLLRDPDTPVAVYFHENQFSYPVSPRSNADLTFAAMNWKSMLAADQIYFNSQFHMDEVFARLPGFLKNFPDHRHLHRVDEVHSRSSVLPIGIEPLATSNDVATPGEPPLILWAQRWEHDKNPAEMIEAVDALIASGASFRIALAGENFRNEPAEFLAARDRWGNRLIHFGWADRRDYDALLREADVVISTALHEFFGIAVVEAVAAGAWPILPNRLSYPEILDPAHQDEHLYDDFEELVDMLKAAIEDVDGRRDLARKRAEFYSRYEWRNVAPMYDAALETLVRRTFTH